MPTQKAFVTGATGFIGKALTKKLIEHGYSVKVLVRNREKAQILKPLGVDICFGDITNISSLEESFRDIDTLFHLAAWYELGIEDKEKMYQVNVIGTQNVMETAKKLHIPKIVYCSTTAVIGNTKGTVVNESHVHCGQFYSHYEKTKFLAHKSVEQYILKEKQPIIKVLPGIVYGPEDKKESSITKLITDFISGKLPANVRTNATFTCVYIDDVASGILLAAEKGIVGSSYILGGEIIRVEEFIKLIRDFSGRPAPRLTVGITAAKTILLLYKLRQNIFGIKSPINKESLDVVGPTTWSFDSCKAKRELGWEFRSVRVGLKETVDWYMQNIERYK